MAALNSLLRGWRNAMKWSKSSTSQVDGYVQERLPLFDSLKATRSGDRRGPARASAIGLYVPTTVKLATILAGAVILLVGAVAAGAFSAGGRNAPMAAASPTPTATPAKSAGQTLCEKFVSHLAQNLGKNASEVKTATVNAVSQTLDDAVAAGTLPKAQADRLKQQLANGPVCASAFSSRASADAMVKSGDDEEGGSDD